MRLVLLVLALLSGAVAARAEEMPAVQAYRLALNPDLFIAGATEIRARELADLLAVVANEILEPVPGAGPRYAPPATATAADAESGTTARYFDTPGCDLARAALWLRQAGPHWRLSLSVRSAAFAAASPLRDSEGGATLTETLTATAGEAAEMAAFDVTVTRAERVLPPHYMADAAIAFDQLEAALAAAGAAAPADETELLAGPPLREEVRALGTVMLGPEARPEVRLRLLHDAADPAGGDPRVAELVFALAPAPAGEGARDLAAQLFAELRRELGEAWLAPAPPAPAARGLREDCVPALRH
jgi:hypothetical protein